MEDNTKITKDETQSLQSQNGARETLCWSCRNCVNSDTHHCPWSEWFEPVPGWEATETSVDRQKSYFVHSCPLYDKDPEYYNANDPDAITAAIKKTFPEFSDYYLVGNKAILENATAEYKGLRLEYVSEIRKTHPYAATDISLEEERKLKHRALTDAFYDWSDEELSVKKQRALTTGLNAVDRYYKPLITAQNQN